MVTEKASIAIRVNDQYRVCFVWSEGMRKSLTTTESEEFYPIITPGEILKDEFVEPLGLSIHGLARKLDVPATRIQAIINDGRGLSVTTSSRLSGTIGQLRFLVRDI